MMRLLICVSCAFAFIVFIAASAHAAPVINESTTYYDISGQTINTLREQMSAKGPRDPNSGVQVWGKTEWYVNWKINYKPVGVGCKIDTVAVELLIKFTYPKWLNRANAHPQVKAQWDRFYKALVAHEAIHARNGIGAANQLEEELPKLYSRNDCNRFKQEVNNRAGQIVRSYANADILFDQRTNNGRNEGVTLP